MEHALRSSFPELQACSLPSWLAIIAAMTEKIRATCGDKGQGLDVVEYYAGAGAVTLACAEMGLMVKPFDIEFAPDAMWDRETRPLLFCLRC